MTDAGATGHEIRGAAAAGGGGGGSAAAVPPASGNGATAERRSYTTTGFRLGAVMRAGMRQFAALRSMRHAHKQGDPDLLLIARQMESDVRERCGVELRGLKTLEIGHGQSQVMIAFVASRGNDATGIDMDVTPRGLTDVRGFWRMWRTNGAVRTAKSAARAATGVDSALRRDFCRQLGIDRWPRYTTRTMDATRMTFGDASFDFVYSTDVFEHVAEPERALAEIVRVLRPGGAMWLRFSAWTWYNALHDLRAIIGTPDAPPPWSHLVPRHEHLVRQSAFVNTLRIAEWKQLLERMCPGANVECQPLRDPTMRPHLELLRAEGELKEYTDEELLTDRLIVTWRKPG